MTTLSNHFKTHFKGQAQAASMIQGDKYRFTILTEQLIRIEYSEEGVFEDRPTQSVINRVFDVPSFRIIDTEEQLEIITQYVHLYYKKGPLSANNLFIDVKGQFNNHGSRWYYGIQTDNLGGTARTLDDEGGEIPLEDGVLSREGFAVMDDALSHIVTEEGWVEPRVRGCIDLYFWGYGRDYIKCMKDFFTLTGSTPLLPRYALGNWWSRYWPYDEASYKVLMNRFKQEEIPFSVAVIDMDWHITEIDAKYGTGWTGYTWNKALFPEPAKFMEWLHKENLKVTLNLHPASGVRAFEEMYEPMAKALGVSYQDEDPIPFDITNPAFMEAYFKYLHHPREEEGVDFWWIDWQQGSTTGVEGLDPLWMLNHYHYYDLARQDKRGLIFSRYAGIGSHRYPVGFSGDTHITWEAYAFQPYFTATASNIGYCWWSHDIGGHMLGERDDELSARWVQYGVFSPIMRLHSSCSPFTGKEPWNYGMDVEKTMKEHLRLRHQLIPYIYTMNDRLHREHIPFIMPLYYNYPMAHEAYEMKHQYFFGSELMICPVIEKINPHLQMAPVKTWLPEGEWFDFYDGTKYRGGSYQKLFRGIDRQVVLAKAGAIIPLAQDKEGIGNPKELEILVFPGASNTFTLVEDNGAKVVQEEERALTTITLQWEENKGTLKIQAPTANTDCIPEDRTTSITIKGVPEETKETICIKGGAVEAVVYNEQTKSLTLKQIKGSVQEELVIVFVCEKQSNHHARMIDHLTTLLQKAQIAYAQKDSIYWTAKNSKDPLTLLQKIRHFNLEEDLYDAILEVVTCAYLD